MTGRVRDLWSGWKSLAWLLALAWIVTAYGQKPADPMPMQPTTQPMPPAKGWTAGVGWGEWGPNDEVGALNAMTPQSIVAAMQLAKEGKVFDLGVTYSRNSFKWPGHSPCEVMTFRSPDGVKQQKDHPATAPEVNPAAVAWHSSAIFISDNVGTQIDGLGHITVGHNNHWYNNFAEQEWGGDFGIRKCDATTIPPIITRAVMLDIAAVKKVEALPRGYSISRQDIDAALAAQKVEIRPGDAVFIRTGTLRYWGKDGSDWDKIKEHDTAGITLGTAKYLVQNFGAMLIGSDTSGLEVSPAEEGSDTFIPVHKYLLVEQGVHIGEFHNLEELAANKVYEFCYICLVNKIAGTTAGFALRPIAIK